MPPKSPPPPSINRFTAAGAHPHRLASRAPHSPRVGDQSDDGANYRTIDDDVTDRASMFIRDAVDEEKPFFIWWNATRMHMWTRLKEESKGASGQGEYNDAMVETRPTTVRTSTPGPTVQPRLGAVRRTLTGRALTAFRASFAGLPQPVQALAREQIQTFIDFPPRQDPASFNLDDVMESVSDATGSGLR
jgi:hypothetical protein